MKTIDRINIIRDFAMSSESEDTAYVFNMWLEIYNEMATDIRLGAKEFKKIADAYNELVSHFDDSVDLNNELFEKYTTVYDKYTKLLKDYENICKTALDDTQRTLKFLDVVKETIWPF